MPASPPDPSVSPHSPKKLQSPAECRIEHRLEAGGCGAHVRGQGGGANAAEVAHREQHKAAAAVIVKERGPHEEPAGHGEEGNRSGPLSQPARVCRQEHPAWVDAGWGIDRSKVAAAAWLLSMPASVVGAGNLWVGVLSPSHGWRLRGQPGYVLQDRLTSSNRQPGQIAVKLGCLFRTVCSGNCANSPASRCFTVARVVRFTSKFLIAWDAGAATTRR